MRTAAVEHRVRRGNGAVLVTGVKMAQQLEKATTNYYCLYEHVAGIHYTNCHHRVLKLDAQHCLSHIRSLLRLRGAAGRPGRNRRLRAQTETHSQMPTLRLVNSWGNQLSRNATNSGIDRSSKSELPVPCSFGSGIAGAPTPTRSRGCSVEWNLIGLESDYREGCREGCRSAE